MLWHLDGSEVPEEHQAGIVFFANDEKAPFRIFETLRTLRGGNFLWCEEHLERLTRSAEFIKMALPVPIETIAESLKACTEKNAPKKHLLRIRILVSKDHYGIQVWELFPEPTNIYHDGVRIQDTVFERPTPTAKTLYTAYQTFRERKGKDIYETIFFSPNGHLLEGNITNVFAVFGNEVLTPPIENVLPGIMRDKVFRALEKSCYTCRESIITREELQKADAIFLTNSIRGVIPVTEWDNWKSTSQNVPHFLRASFPYFEEQ